MSVQEVMQLVEKNSILSTLSIALFFLTVICLIVSYILFPTPEDRYNYPKSVKVAFIVVATLTFLAFCGTIAATYLNGCVESKIEKTAINKKVTRHTTWYQDENVDYHFGKYRVIKEDVSVIKHQPKLKKPYAKVTTKYISNRFSKKQKAKILQNLSEGTKEELKSTAVIHK